MGQCPHNMGGGRGLSISFPVCNRINSSVESSPEIGLLCNGRRSANLKKLIS